MTGTIQFCDGQQPRWGGGWDKAKMAWTYLLDVLGDGGQACCTVLLLDRSPDCAGKGLDGGGLGGAFVSHKERRIAQEHMWEREGTYVVNAGAVLPIESPGAGVGSLWGTGCQ